MTKPIAKIRLAQGIIGWYDSLTNIRLTMASPEAVVSSGKNIAGIKKGIKEGKIILKEGSLSLEQRIVEPIKDKPIIKTKEAKKEMIKQQPNKKENKSTDNESKKPIIQQPKKKEETKAATLLNTTTPMQQKEVKQDNGKDKVEIKTPIASASSDKKE